MPKNIYLIDNYKIFISLILILLLFIDILSIKSNNSCFQTENKIYWKNNTNLEI